MNMVLTHGVQAQFVNKLACWPRQWERFLALRHDAVYLASTPSPHARPAQVLARQSTAPVLDHVQRRLQPVAGYAGHG
jgi:hypothetical protein